jgi:hypothetical protein
MVRIPAAYLYYRRVFGVFNSIPTIYSRKAHTLTFPSPHIIFYITEYTDNKDSYILILSAKIFDLYINFDFESRLIYTIKDKNPTTFYIKT